MLQNTFLVVFMHYTRVAPNKNGGILYASSTAVVSMEIVKMISCLMVVAYSQGSIGALIDSLQQEVVRQPMELVKLAVPSVLYSIQNNLLYYALSHLDAATFQVGYQLKILTTAIFSMYILGKRLTSNEWIALVLLFIGVCMAQLSAHKRADEHANTTLGGVAVLLAACTSGFSGVYFESILKSSTGTSLWMRNIQMGVSSIVAAYLGVYMSGELPSVIKLGFFHGYTWMVIWVILLQAVGGLIVAVVVKYADNILKGFAASFSIVTSCILSYFFFDFQPNLEFFAGAVLVNISMYLYSYKPSVRKSDKEEAVDDKNIAAKSEKNHDNQHSIQHYDNAAVHRAIPGSKLSSDNV